MTHPTDRREPRWPGGTGSGSSDLQHPMKPKNPFTIAPLILEGHSATKSNLNKRILTKLPQAKLADIQENRKNGTFILLAADISSFNILLNSATNLAEGNETIKIYIPRSIQKILDADKEAYVKNVDLDIQEQDIREELEQNGFQIENLSRIFKKDNSGPTRTLKVTFTDNQNRNSFVQTGLQIQHMHFPAERANHNAKPTQCYICLQYGHVSKYCKKPNQTCAHCGENHHQEKCEKTDNAPKCCNCQGQHLATSTNCPKYQEQQRRITETINKYSSTGSKQNALKTTTTTDERHFPTLAPSQTPPPTEINAQFIPQLISTVTDALLSVFREATKQMLEEISQKVENLFERIMYRQSNRSERDSTAEKVNEIEKSKKNNKKEKNKPNIEKEKEQQGANSETQMIDQAETTKNNQASSQSTTPHLNYLYRSDTPQGKRKEISPNDEMNPTKTRANDPQQAKTND